MNDVEWTTFSHVDEMIAGTEATLFAQSFMQYKFALKNGRYHSIEVNEADDRRLRLLGVSSKGVFSHDLRISIDGPGLAPLERHWNTLLRAVAARNIHSLTLEVIAQEPIELPELAKETDRNAALIYVIDLGKDARYATNPNEAMPAHR